MDFGGMKEFKAWVDYMFDHTLIIAQDDPEFQTLVLLDGKLADVRVVDGVGCEMFAKMCYDKMDEILVNGLTRYPVNPTVRIKSVEVFEHGSNSAIYER
jgi:6-pyruvoyltetrahydropterin/6-carboxytetrahydropterin synthase